MTSALVAVPVNTPIAFDLTLSADVGAGGWQPGNGITLDLLHTVTLNPSLVFVLPNGVTISSANLNISNNQWTDPRVAGAVPEPASLSLVAFGAMGVIGVLRRRVRQAS